MRFLAWNMALSAWLLIAAFALPHPPASAALTGLLAVLIGTFALASPGLRGLRFVNAALALVLGWAALLLPEVSWIARVNDAIVAAVVFALAVIPGRSTVPQDEATPAVGRASAPPAQGSPEP
jgi:hypothetical protein